MDLSALTTTNGEKEKKRHANERAEFFIVHISTNDRIWALSTEKAVSDFKLMR